MRHDPITPDGFTRTLRAAQIHEATLAVTAAKRWINVARTPAEHAQARLTLAQASRWLLRLNLQTCEVINAI